MSVGDAAAGLPTHTIGHRPHAGIVEGTGLLGGVLVLAPLGATSGVDLAFRVCGARVGGEFIDAATFTGGGLGVPFAHGLHGAGFGGAL